MSSLSIETYNSLKSKHSLKLELPLKQLKAGNQLPFETRSVVGFPVILAEENSNTVFMFWPSRKPTA